MKIFRFVKKVLFLGLTILSGFTNANYLSFISMNNLECKTRPQVINVKVFNLMSRTNETRYIEWHETRNCDCKFGENVCNKKQRWNKNKCRCEC